MVQAPRFLKYHQNFDQLLGLKPSSQLLCDASDSGLPLFHEACIYHSPSKSIFVTSNQIHVGPGKSNAATNDQHVKLFRIYDDGSQKDGLARYEEVEFSGIVGAMLNGGVNASSAHPDTLLFCAQGSNSPDDLSGIISLEIPSQPSEPYRVSKAIVTSFHDRPFNSVNDVIVNPRDDSVWFTDPSYGYHQSIRPTPVLPNHVYRFDPSTSAIRVMTDGFVRPNGLCFSPDLKTLYVTDTGAIHGSPNVPIDPAGQSHIYAFDIIERSGEPFLANRRLFAYAPGRFPDGIKCDTEGNVYSGCGDGIEVWNPAGVLIGTIEIDGGVANFCFGECGTIYACNETRFWRVNLSPEHVRGSLLGL